jgi:hypothetical protein
MESDTTRDWEQIRPMLDTALDGLSAADRDALVLRFFERHSLAQVGQRLGLTEDAARKRVHRALDKLRTRLDRQGLVVTCAALGMCISANAVQMAPDGIAVTLTSTALSGAAAKSGALLTLLKILTMTKLKLGLISAIVIVVVTTPLIVHYRASLKLGTSRQLSPSREQPPHSAEYFQRLHQMAADKERDVKALGRAFHIYASEHNDQFPTNLEAVETYLSDGKLSPTEREIEIYYQGPLAELGSNPNQGEFILFRDKQAWAGPDGKPARVYGMGDGSVQTIESDDNFKSWEAPHSFRPSTSN